MRLARLERGWEGKQKIDSEAGAPQGHRQPPAPGLRAHASLSPMMPRPLPSEVSGFGQPAELSSCDFSFLLGHWVSKADTVIATHSAPFSDEKPNR